MSEQTTKPHLADTLDSVTGYDEIAITQAFGRYFGVLVDDPTMLARALIFVLKRREGMKDAEAKKFVMELRVGQVNDWFDNDEDADPEDPDTPAGEGDSQPA